MRLKPNKATAYRQVYVAGQHTIDLPRTVAKTDFALS